MPYTVEDLSLEVLEKAGWISVRAINICKNNQLIGLKDIISFYRKYGSFKKLENCGDKTEKELSEICMKFNNNSLDVIIKEIKEQDEIKKMVREFTDDEIDETNKYIEYLTFKLSVRARNGLQSIFNGTPKAIELFDKICSPSFSFNRIRNIGSKTVAELDNFTQSLLLFLKKFQIQGNGANISGNVLPIIIKDLDVNFVKIVNEFSPFKKAALNRHIEYLISNLTIRAKNGITQFFGEKFTAKEIVDTIYSYSFNFQVIKNIGSRTVLELNDFKINLSSFIEKLRFIEDDHLSREYAKLIVKTTFCNLPINFNEQFENFFESTGKIKLFKLIYFLVENDSILKQKEKQLFYYLYTEAFTKSLEQIAIELDLGKERLRQLRITFEDEIQNYFRFVLSFNSQDLASYSISTDTPFKIIDKEFIQKINTREDVQFNILFYSIIFGLLLENSHSILGDDENISGKGNYSTTVRFKNCYLIEKKLFHSFSFESFANDIYANQSSRITETYSLHYEGYLLQFMYPEGKQFLPRIKEICEVILYNEFDLVVNNEGYIIFERNVRKPLPEYTFEILEMLGKMTKIDDIVKAINNKYPELDINEQSIRSTLQRDKELFIYIGRSSTYGLRKWELENKALKGGTIRDIAEEYLEKFETPQHTYDIVNYVKKYRETSGISILTNIQSEDKNRFIFFKGGFIGLKSKIYKPSDTDFKRIAGMHFCSKYLKKFNGWNFDKVVAHYVRTHNYKPVQIISLFETKIQGGEMILNENNTITI